MNRLTRRTALAGCAAACAAGTWLGSTNTASASPVWTLNYNATVTTSIVKLGKSVTTTGTNVSQFDLGTRALTSDLRTKPVTTSALSLGSLNLAYATVAIEPVAVGKGSVSNDNQISIRQQAYLHVTKLTGPAKLVNLVGSSCRTSTPVTFDVTGKQGGLFDPITLKGTFTVPKFTGCGAFGALNSVINSKMAGSGNTVTINLTPKA